MQYIITSHSSLVLQYPWYKEVSPFPSTLVFANLKVYCTWSVGYVCWWARHSLRNKCLPIMGHKDLSFTGVTRYWDEDNREKCAEKKRKGGPCLLGYTKKTLKCGEDLFLLYFCFLFFLLLKRTKRLFFILNRAKLVLKQRAKSVLLKRA